MSVRLSNEEIEKLLAILKERFINNMSRHPNTEWINVMKRIQGKPEKLRSLLEMEQTGGEPDIVGDDYIFMDCSTESPKGRRSICYDYEALEARKKNKPKHDAQSMASEMGISVLTEEEYRYLQNFGDFDLKSSSWITTPDKIRKLGGALFGDNRYDTVFIYHNGAQSYYSNRGFRGKLEV